jgi:hypothetical protein
MQAKNGQGRSGAHPRECAPRRAGNPKPSSGLGSGPLIHFEDTGGLHDRRSFLAFSKAGSLLAVNINASELLAVCIIDGDLPVAVLPPTIAAESRASPFPFGFVFLFQEVFLARGSIPTSLRPRKFLVDYLLVRHP